MGTANDRQRHSIMAMYRSQLETFKRLSVYDNDGNFLFGKTTDFGTKVTEVLINITRKRLMELTNENLEGRGIKPLENYTNGQADKEV